MAHSTNGGKPIDLFHWFEDGELRTTFESPAARDGSTPDVDGKAAVLALAERLTGIRVTEALLQDATYELGLVPEQPAEEWSGVVIDITDAHGERRHREWTYEEIATPSDRARAEADAPVVNTTEDT